MSAPDPAKVSRELDKLVSRAASIEPLYRTLYAMGYRTRRGNGVKVSGGDMLDVAQLLGASAAARGKLEACGRALLDASIAVGRALDHLHDLSAMLDEHVMDASRQDTPRDVEFPSDLAPHEHARLMKTKRRREKAIAEGKGRMPWSQTEVDGS